MILSNCSLKFNDQIYEDLLVEYAESNDEISIHLADNMTAVQKLSEQLNKNDLRTKIVISGSDEKGERHLYELENPAAHQLNLNPFFISMSFKK